MIYFISYDVSDAKRLHKVAKTLENYGIRVQYSFFEWEMKEEQKTKLVSEILKIIKVKEDSLLVYPLCEDCIQTVQSVGQGSLFKPSTFMVL